MRIYEKAFRISLMLGLTSALSACRQSTPSSTPTVDKYGTIGATGGSGGRSRGVVAVTKESPELRRRADSLSRLDPVQEALAAVARDDLRYLAACQRGCVIIGIHPDTTCLLERCQTAPLAEVHPLEGADLPPMNADVKHFDSVAVVYGARYNEVIRAHRPRRTLSRPIG